MKKLYILLTAVLLTATTFAQAPEKMSYQAIVRDGDDFLLTNQTIGMQISILQNIATGTAVYVETQTPITNVNGLVTLEIGTGSVVNGNFTTIDWSGGIYFIKTETDPAGGSSYSITGTSQLLSVPYALHAKTADSFVGSSTLDDAYDFGGAGAGRTVTVDAGEVKFTTSTPSGIAVRTTNNNTGSGIVSTTTNSANGFSAIQANTNSTASGAAAIVGNTTGSAYGVAGQVAATASAESGVYGSNLRTNGGNGVLGIGFNGTVGQTEQSSGYGIYGENFDNIAPLGNGIGVAGKGYYGVLGEDRYQGGQAGAYGMYSNGSLGSTGTKTFRIDHPKDPENKFLRHFSIESDEVLNVYRGTTVFDATGEAIIALPDYFNDINRNVSYQLTPIGAYMPLFIKEKVNGSNHFVVGGGISGKEVSWSVYAERNDLYLQKNPEQRTVELEKRPQEKGKYLIPQLYNAGPKKGIFGNGINPKKQVILNVMD